MQNQEILLFLNGVKYRLDSVLKNGAQGPVIEVQQDQLNDLSNRAHVVTFGSEDKSVDPSLLISIEKLVKEKPEVIFFKQDGKFTVIAGRNRVEQAEGPIKGRLLSTPALKKARVSDFVSQRPAANYPREFANRPRIIQRQRKTLER